MQIYRCKALFLMKKKILFILFVVVACYPALAQIRCEETTTWLTYFEQGKAQPRSKDSEYLKCTDTNGNMVKEREFGQGRVLRYTENTYDAENKLIRTHYTHGYESNDGGEGTITYQYLSNGRTNIDYVAANFTSKTEQKIVKNAKGLITKQDEKEIRKSELLEDYNSTSEISTTFEYAMTDSLLAKKQTIKRNASTHKITELYQYKENLKVRHEHWEEEKGKKIAHTVKTYQYNAQKQLIEEKTFELPAYLTKSVTLTSYQEGKIKEIEKIDYKDFEKKEMEYCELKKFEYDAKGELSKTSLMTRYFYAGAFASFVEKVIEQQGNTKKVITTSYDNKSENKKITIDIFQADKLLRTEDYEGEKLNYIYEYEYAIK